MTYPNLETSLAKAMLWILPFQYLFMSCAVRDHLLRFTKTSGLFLALNAYSKLAKGTISAFVMTRCTRHTDTHTHVHIFILTQCVRVCVGGWRVKYKEAAWLHEFKLHILKMHNRACDRCAFLSLLLSSSCFLSRHSHIYANITKTIEAGKRMKLADYVALGSSIQITYR